MLSHINLQKHLIDPIRRSLFKIEIVTDDLTDEEKTTFSYLIKSINKSSICFNLNIIENRIEPINILTKIDNFDLKIISHDVNDNVLCVFYYENVKLINFDMDIFFDYESQDIIPDFTTLIDVDDIYVVENEKKIKIVKYDF